MSSLLDVAKAMNAEAASNTTKLSLLDVAQDENATSSMSLMDVAKKETITSEVPKKTLQQLAQDIDNEDRSRIQVALESTAEEVKVERQELCTQIIRQTADVVQQEEVQAAQVLREKVAAVDSSNPKVEQNEEDDEADGYSSFEDDDDSLPKRENKNKKEEKAQDDDPTEEEENYEPPPRTTPSESKESKEFLRAVYRADKYQVRDMLNGKIVDANIADQVSAIGQNATRFIVLTRPLHFTARLEWSALGCFSKPRRHFESSSAGRS
ncbi:unnamed protein product [Phytophthora lilii]|uniref:Unnamed protein product n=1 Tax=Phytophthora lilii TaxID=2077276 RepID=A0A9W6WRS8_9STRA|nr:unnamed protein product [Phytophthora lilii]